MSYILQIWEPPAGQPLPRDMDSVLAAVEGLEEGAPRPSARFAPLLEHLLRRYPDITSAAAQQVPESAWAWSDGPLAASTRDTVMVLGLRSETVDAVQPFVVEQATAQGLAVLDPQAGAAWFPGGLSIGLFLAARPRRAEAAPARVPKCPEAAFLVIDGLAPLLTAAGFQPARNSMRFKRTFSGGWQEIVLLLEDRGTGGCTFALLSRIRIDEVSELHASVFPRAMPEEKRRAEPTVSLAQRDWVEDSEFVPGTGRNRDYVISKSGDLNALIARMTADCRDRLLPILDGCRSTEGVDRVLNTDPLEDSMFFQYYDRMDFHILFAYLARNPRLEAICKQILDNVTDNDHLDSARKCVEYVRAHPLPWKES
jgi:hypothetical protein